MSTPQNTTWGPGWMVLSIMVIWSICGLVPLGTVVLAEMESRAHPVGKGKVPPLSDTFPVLLAIGAMSIILCTVTGPCVWGMADEHDYADAKAYLIRKKHVFYDACLALPVLSLLTLWWI